MQCDVFIIICDVVRAENSKLVDNQKLRAQARNTIYTFAILILAIIIFSEGFAYRGCQNTIHSMFDIMVTS